MQFHQFNSSDPFTRARNVEGMIELLREHCEQEATKLSDPEARSLFETSASVLDGLSHAFQNFLTKDQVPWECFEDSFPQKSSDPWD